jgi:hypothetical protein
LSPVLVTPMYRLLAVPPETSWAATEFDRR